MLKGEISLAKIEKYTLKSGETRYKVKVYLGIDPKTGVEKRTTIRFKTHKEAKEALADITFKRSKGMLNFGESNEDSLTFNDVYIKWLPIYEGTVQETTYDKTVIIFTKHILPKLGKFKIKKITVDDCQLSVNQWRKILKRYRMIKNYASKLFDFAQMRGYIEKNPMKLVFLPPTRMGNTDEDDENENFYTKQEFKQFETCLETLLDLKKKAFFTILGNAGLRRSEALALTWKDIDFSNQTILINKALKYGRKNGLYKGPTKTYNSRTISVNKKTMDAISEWKHVQEGQLKLLNQKHHGPKQLLFNNTSNNYINPNQPSRWLKDFLLENELRLISNHGLRHTHCTLLFQAGVDLKTIQQRLGHNDVQTTLNIYTHFSKQNAQAAPNKLDSFLQEE